MLGWYLVSLPQLLQVIEHVGQRVLVLHKWRHARLRAQVCAGNKLLLLNSMFR
jgi:hypothetical protein